MTNTMPEPEGVKPGENIPRKFYGNVLSRTVNNADGTVMLNDDSLTLSCPQVHRTRAVGKRPTTYFSKILLKAEALGVVAVARRGRSHVWAIFAARSLSCRPTRR